MMSIVLKILQIYQWFQKVVFELLTLHPMLEFTYVYFYISKSENIFYLFST